MHTEEKLSDWVLITTTSRHSSGKGGCQADSVQDDIAWLGTCAEKQSEDKDQRNMTVLGLFFFLDHGACLL